MANEHFTMAEKYREFDDDQLAAEMRALIKANKIPAEQMQFIADLAARNKSGQALTPEQRVKASRIMETVTST